MLDFMDYIVHAFGESTGWNPDNSYSSLTATSDALLSFPTPSTLSLHVSSLSTPHFASSYTLSTLGQIDGSVAYLYSNVALAHIPSQSPSIPLARLVRGYRDVRLPVAVGEQEPDRGRTALGNGKPTLLHATLALPPPSVLTAVYARRVRPDTLLALSLYSKSVAIPVANASPPPASVLAHLQHDTGQYSIEGLGSTDNGLLGIRGLWNFGLSPEEDPSTRSTETRQPHIPPGSEASDGMPLASPAVAKIADQYRLPTKPSLLSAGAEFYYSPFSHVIGLSTGLRFTTLVPCITPPSEPTIRSTGVLANKPLAGTSASVLSSASHGLLTPSNVSHSSFPYTMTLTLTPLTGSISSTYSVRPTSSLALSSRFDFNFYSWESRYVVGGELWRPRRPRRDRDRDQDQDRGDPELPSAADDPTAWARRKTQDWFTTDERALKDERVQREEENVLKFRVDDSWNVRALWTGRVKSLLLSAGVSVSPVARPSGAGGVAAPRGEGESLKRWTGSVGVSIAYST